jgi:hypothetical protein
MTPIGYAIFLTRANPQLLIIPLSSDVVLLDALGEEKSSDDNRASLPENTK